MEKLVAFDLDGTLSRSDLFLLPAYQTALTKMGRPLLSDEVLLTMIGGTTLDNAQIISSGDMEDYGIFNDYVQEELAAHMATHARAYPGIAQSIETLRTHDCRIVLCSNAMAHYSRPLLASIGLLDLFHDIPQSQPGWDKQHLLKSILETYHPKAAVMVGDRHFDIEAARAVNIPVIGCGYGLAPSEVIGADIVVASASELPDAVERLLHM